MEQQANAAEALANVLSPGSEVVAIAASGVSVPLVVRAFEADRLDVDGEGAQEGDVLTARVSDGSVVWFLQLVTTAVRGTAVNLRIVASLPIRSERWMERVPYDAPVRVLGDAGSERSGRMCDVSPLGARLHVVGGAQVGQSLDLRVPAGDAEVALRVRVVRVGSETPDGVEIAGEVVSLAPADWVRLERVLDTGA